VVVFACSRALCDGVAYDDGGVPVGDLGVVVELCCANSLLAGLQNKSATCFDGILEILTLLAICWSCSVGSGEAA
jgi:hypothetical protein